MKTLIEEALEKYGELIKDRNIPASARLGVSSVDAYAMQEMIYVTRIKNELVLTTHPIIQGGPLDRLGYCSGVPTKEELFSKNNKTISLGDVVKVADRNVYKRFKIIDLESFPRLECGDRYILEVQSYKDKSTVERWFNWRNGTRAALNLADVYVHSLGWTRPQFIETHFCPPNQYWDLYNEGHILLLPEAVHKERNKQKEGRNDT